MAIKISCPHCGQTYSLVEKQAGKKIRCKSCDEPFVVRAAASPNEESRASREEDDDRAERKGRPKKGGIPLWVFLCAGGTALFLLVVIGVVGVVIWKKSTSKITPENFAKIQPGMAEAEVKSLLGEPTREEKTMDNLFGMIGQKNPLKTDARTYVWEDGNQRISVSFCAGKVAGSSSSFPGGGSGPKLVAANVITEANLRRLKVGMTIEQVKQILGPPTQTDDSNLSNGKVKMQTLHWGQFLDVHFKGMFFDGKLHGGEARTADGNLYLLNEQGLHGGGPGRTVGFPR